MKDQVIPKDKWEFDESVTTAFDDMLARSIPQYEVMRSCVFDVGSRFQQRGAYIVDIGTSRGEAIAPFIDRFGALNTFTLVEISPPMLAAVRARFRGMELAGVVEVLELDLRKEYPARGACVTLSVLTLQFTPIEHRQRILRDAFNATLPGGAFILVEKVLGATADLDSAMVDLYYNMKRANGYTEEQIQRKKLSLEGVLVPVTAQWNEELLRRAGFSQIDCFWRWMNFAGWVAVKD